MKRNIETRKKYLEANKEKIAKQKKAYYEANKLKLINYGKIWREKNSDKIKAYYKRKRATDTIYKLKGNIRCLIKNSIIKEYKKDTNTIQILGCSFEEFKQHLEANFEPWMNWGNYGKPSNNIYEPNKTWDIDHIIPLANAKTIDDVIRLNHYTNLQPLCSYNNRYIKRDVHKSGN
jgi:hypothetical protein